jgi:hypothetical protein
VFSVGFGPTSGTVIAGREWGDVMQVMRIPEAVAQLGIWIAQTRG